MAESKAFVVQLAKVQIQILTSTHTLCYFTVATAKFYVVPTTQKHKTPLVCLCNNPIIAPFLLVQVFLQILSYRRHSSAVVSQVKQKSKFERFTLLVVFPCLVARFKSLDAPTGRTRSKFLVQVSTHASMERGGEFFYLWGVPRPTCFCNLECEWKCTYNQMAIKRREYIIYWTHFWVHWKNENWRRIELRSGILQTEAVA